MSIVGLSRESGVSETTIRYIGRPEKRQRATLVALSAGLRCRHDYLADVLARAADPEAPQSPDDTTVTREFLRSELGSLEERIYKLVFPLSRNMQEIDGKINVILGRRRKEREPPPPPGSGRRKPAAPGPAGAEPDNARGEQRGTLKGNR